VDRTNALTYLRKVKSILLRKYGYWEVYRCKRSGIDFYYHTLTEELAFYPPQDMTWRAILRESTKQKEILGYAQDWWVYKDKYGNTFYRNRISRYCEYERSPDAKEMKPSEKLCTSFQVTIAVALSVRVYNLILFFHFCFNSLSIKQFVKNGIRANNVIVDGKWPWQNVRCKWLRMMIKRQVWREIVLF
jgi:hypothetical protein